MSLIDKLAQRALLFAPNLLPQMFPDGKRRGNMFIIESVRFGAEGRLTINLDTGGWVDRHRTKRQWHSGRDLVDLISFQRDLNRVDAGELLVGVLTAGAATGWFV